MPQHYFDFNATTPLSRAAKAAWLEASDRFWQNPSGLYRKAAAAKAALEGAREQVAEYLGCEPHEIVFTSGATESNNAVMRWAARGGRALVSSIEHPSVREASDGAAFLPTDESGVVKFQFPPTDKPSLVSIMAANNETGVIQPWQEFSAECRAAKVLFHCDAAQWIGKLPAAGLGECDFVTGSAHKFGGPKGVGFLKLPSADIAGFSLQKGGPQEFRHRAGTENVAGILSMMAAWEERESAMGNDSTARDSFEEKMAEVVPGVRIIAKNSPRLWNTSLIILPEIPNTKWLARLSDLGFSVSTGSACSSGAGASDVLLAMGIEGEFLRRVLRVSSGWDHTPADWQALAEGFEQLWLEFKTGVGKRDKISL